MTDDATRARAAAASTAADAPAAHVPDGAKAIDTVQGDLTGNGTVDTLLVVAAEEGPDARLGEGPSRRVMLLTRDPTGRLSKAAENARIVPCARCGGIAGDPYAYARIDGGAFTIAVSGGSRERWFADYVFRHVPEQSSWRLERVIRGVTDTQSGRQKQVELTQADFGDVAFAEFDPATLPAMTLE